ncbi:MAG TPA: replication-relaxation family protein [Candidatus Limnocylindrales bacterium]|nr:replication-relaxation family protein [Candidatus Limnocylindrales bacterium]
MLKPKNPKHHKANDNTPNNGCKPGNAGRRRKPIDVPPLVRLRNHVTDRDRRILDWLYDHHTLTTAQIAHALFPSLDFAQRRLLTLTGLTAVTRFRPNKLDGGSYPFHYVLDQLGFTYIMGERGQGLPRRDEARRRLQSVTTRPDLRHLLGVNQLFTDLAGHARTHDGCVLERWRPASAFHSFGDFMNDGDDLMLAVGAATRIPRPDGHGVWREHGRAVPFFVEFDTGSERHDTLAEKIFKYATLSAGTTWVWPALFVLPTQRREDNLHHHIAAMNRPPAALWYTTSVEYLDAARQTAAEAVWRPGGQLRQQAIGPIRLIDLPYHDPNHDSRWQVRNPQGDSEELRTLWAPFTGHRRAA